MAPKHPIPDALKAALADHYRLERELGSGGMARVYLAEDLKHDRKVAIKVLKSEFGAMLGAERFLSEIKVTAKLQHPNLLPLFDSGAAGGRLFYVMPFIEGETLRERVQRERALPVDETLRLVGLIAGALDFAHARGVVHRDLKPENILLQAGQPVIADFGIALAVRNAGGKRITQSGFSLGTPEYMSPEQAAGDHGVDARSDQYALAVLAYEMLAGQPPHAGATAQVIINRVVSEPARSLRNIRPDVSPAVDAALLRALSKDPAERYASCGDFARVFSAAVPERPEPLAPDTVRVRSSLIGAGALLIALASGAIVWWTQARSRAAAQVPQIERLAAMGNYPAAFALAQPARRYLGGDSSFIALFYQVSNEFVIRSDPSGAQVFVSAAADSTQADTSEGRLIGTTPITGYLMARDDYRIMLKLAGRKPVRTNVSRFMAEPEGLGGKRVLTLDIRLPAPEQ